MPAHLASFAVGLVLLAPGPADGGPAEVEAAGAVLRLPAGWSAGQLELRRVESAPPADLQAALAGWTNWMSQVEVLASGPTPAGGFYARVRHTVRDGRPGVDAQGRHKHLALEVVEVLGLAPAGPGAYVQLRYVCEGSRARCDEALEIARTLRAR